MASVAAFIKMQGSQHQFVADFRRFEADKKLSELPAYYLSAKNRYLIVTAGPTRIVDFRHFSAAMLLVLEGYAVLPRLPAGGALMAGVANELIQCVGEGYAALRLKQQAKSCFSNEDLGSNRMGVQFGELVQQARVEKREDTVASLLDRYLSRFLPLSDVKLGKLQLNAGSAVAREMLLAVVLGLRELSPAYQLLKMVR